MTISKGWIEWHGGGCPVDQMEIVEVTKRSGHKAKGPAECFRWAHAKSAYVDGLKDDADIIAYRVVATEQPKANSALDIQEGGDHYKKLGNYQPWEVLAKWLTPEELKGFAKGTVVAYLAREEQKGGRLDIKKALHTLQIYLELSEPQQ